jgi:hypothetical protein
MALTDVAATRMPPLARSPSRHFGMRARPPLLVPVTTPKPPHPIKDAARRHWAQMQALVLRLRIAFPLPSIPGIWPTLQVPRLPQLRFPQLRLRSVLHFLDQFRPSLRSRPDRSRKAALYALLYADLRHTLPRLLAYMGALAMLAGGPVYLLRAAPVAAAIEPAQRPEWTAVSKPFPAFALSMPELASAGTNYEVRRHSEGGGRKDIRSWGDVGIDGPHFTLEIYRPGSEFIRFSDAPHEIAVRTEERVAVRNIRSAEPVESKFGPIPAVGFSDKPDGSRRCIGFVRDFEHPRMQIAGWYCAAGAEEVERGMVSCALDRLTLLAGGNDAKLGELFARAELKRHFCGQRSVLLTPTPKLSPAPAATLRGGLSAR